MRPIACFILTLLACCAQALCQPANVTRVLYCIDFEERRLGNPEDTPMHWVKVEGPNLPHYAQGHLTTDQAHGGQYSFRLDLDGGSVIYRYEPGYIKAQPGAHYLVQAYVQTTVLPNARARVTAYFTDFARHPLPQTIRNSDLYAAKEEGQGWTPLQIEMNCDDPRAAWMVLEVALLQPVLYAPPALGERTLFKQDIHGTAWFDDITITQVPQVILSTPKPANAFGRSQELRIDASIDDRYTDDLEGQLIVRDAAHRSVYQRSGSSDLAAARRLGPRQLQLTFALPALPTGWYDAQLQLSSQGQALVEKHIALIKLADDDPPTWPDDRFGMVATDLPLDVYPALPDVFPLLGAGRVKLALWSRQGDVQQLDPTAFDAMLINLQDRHITTTACLVDLPPALAKQLEQSMPATTQPAQANWNALPPPPPPVNPWLQLLSAKPQLWQEPLGGLIARHANHLDRWQLGADGSAQFVVQPQMRKVYDTVYAQFAQLVTHPDLAMPWPAIYELDDHLPATIALYLPTTVLPNQIPLYVQELKNIEGHRLSLSLELLQGEKYGREVQMRDFAQRVIYALSASANRIDIPLPMSIQDNGPNSHQVQPTELFLIARTLLRTLSGARYLNQVPIADGVEAFLFERDSQGILALWDTQGGQTVRQLALNLGPQPLCLDLWGNATPLSRTPSDPAHPKVALSVGSLPIFLVGIDAAMMQFRASVGFDHPAMESTFTSHVRRLHFTSPYATAIAGTLKLRPPAGWNLTPSIIQFSLNPGETFDSDIRIEFPYNSFAGTKTINADFVLQTEKPTAFTVPIALKLGLSDVGMQSLAYRQGNDLLVQQIIQNYGDRPIDYNAFAILPGQVRQDRMVMGLGPGQTTIKRYRFANVPCPPGTALRVGIKELDGTRILNDEVKLP